MTAYHAHAVRTRLLSRLRDLHVHDASLFEFLAQPPAVILPLADQHAHLLRLVRGPPAENVRDRARAEASITLTVQAAISAVALFRAPAPIDVRVLVREVERRHEPLIEGACSM